MNSIVTSLRIIYRLERGDTSSIKEYNNLKQRLMEIGMKNSLYIRLFKGIRKN